MQRGILQASRTMGENLAAIRNISGCRKLYPSGPAGPPPLLGEARRDDYLIGHKLCALIIDQRAALSFSVIFMLRQLGR